MKHYFYKYKYTHQIFYSSMREAAYMEITDDEIIIETPDFPKLSGVYFPFETIRNNSLRITYSVMRVGVYGELFLDIHQNLKGISIYDKELVGIIFKN